MEQDVKSDIVIDNGSGLCKIGFAGDHEPKAEFSSVIGRTKYKVGLLIICVIHAAKIQFILHLLLTQSFFMSRNE